MILTFEALQTIVARMVSAVIVIPNSITTLAATFASQNISEWLAKGCVPTVYGLSSSSPLTLTIQAP